MLRDEEWREVDSIIYKEEKIYVPRTISLEWKSLGYITICQ